MKRPEDLWSAKLLGWRWRLVFERPRDPLQLVLASAVVGTTIIEFEVGLLGFGLCFEGWQLAAYGDGKIYESKYPDSVMHRIEAKMNFLEWEIWILTAMNVLVVWALLFKGF